MYNLHMSVWHYKLSPSFCCHGLTVQGIACVFIVLLLSSRIVFVYYLFMRDRVCGGIGFDQIYSTDARNDICKDNGKYN